MSEFAQFADEMKLKRLEKFSDERFVWTWASQKGLEGGPLLICHVDSPLPPDLHVTPFRRDPEFLFGEAIGSSRAPLTMLEFSLRALRSMKLIRKMPLGILLYADEGMDAQFSEKIIKEVSGKAAGVLVLRPGNPDACVISQRRGLACFQLTIDGDRTKLGQRKKAAAPLLWISEKISKLEKLSDRKNRLAVSVADLKTESFPMLLPHRITAKVLVNYYEAKVLRKVVEEIRIILGDKMGNIKWSMERIFDRPPMKDRKTNRKLLDELLEIAQEWDIPMDSTSSLWPSVSGLVAARTPVLCGLAPVAENLYTPQEMIHRISLMQRILLLTQFLIKKTNGDHK